jgi:hypothetical protein
MVHGVSKDIRRMAKFLRRKHLEPVEGHPERDKRNQLPDFGRKVQDSVAMQMHLLDAAVKVPGLGFRV